MHRFRHIRSTEIDHDPEGLRHLRDSESVIPEHVPKTQGKSLGLHAEVQKSRTRNLNFSETRNIRRFRHRLCQRARILFGTLGQDHCGV